MRNIFLEKSYTKCGGEGSPISISFSGKLKLSLSLDQKPKVLYSLFLLNLVDDYRNILKLSCKPLCKKCPYSELFWSAFSCVWTEYGEKRSISPYSVRMWEIRTRIALNTDTFYAVHHLLLTHLNHIQKIKRGLELFSLPHFLHNFSKKYFSCYSTFHGMVAFTS